ncbi:MAG: hypothetical protein ACLSIR_09580 [Christensenellales bacterium]
MMACLYRSDGEPYSAYCDIEISHTLPTAISRSTNITSCIRRQLHCLPGSKQGYKRHLFHLLSD